MTVTWKFSNLESLADHLDNRAREMRASEFGGPKRPSNIEKRARAAEMESLAYMLRHSEITEKV